MHTKMLNSRSFQDLKGAFSHYRACFFLAFLEVKQRYQRSTLGPWWITLSMLIFILVMGQIFSRLFAQGLSEYLPFFTTGFIFWSLISTTINESAELFKANSGFIKQIKLPYNLYVLKLLTRNVIIFAHNFVVYFFVIWVCGCNPGWRSVVAVPGFILILMNLYWIVFLIALLSARYRDLVPIVASLLQILFFATPISWMPRLLQDSLFVKLNPLTYLLELVRQPLLGALPSAEAWIVAGVSAMVGITGCLLVFHFVRTRIPFWVD